MVTVIFFLQDPHWDKLLRYCLDHCSYEGCPLPLERHDFGDGYYANDDKGNMPDQYSSEVEWGEEVVNQYSTNAEWGDTGKCQYPNEWDEFPRQYTNDIERDKPGQYPCSTDTEWGEQAEKQYSNEAEWDEYIPQQYSNNIGCSEFQKRDELGEDMPNLCNDMTERGKHTYQSESNEGEWDGSKPNECSAGIGTSSSTDKPCAKSIKWEGITITPTGWDD